MKFLLIMLICLLITIVSESILAKILKVKVNELIYVILVNVITNPLLNALLNLSYIIYPFYYNWILIVLEIIVFIIEGFVYKKCIKESDIKPYLLSFCLNIFSLLIGILADIYFW